MARIFEDSGLQGGKDSQEHLTFEAHGTDKIELPSSDFIADSKMTRDGDDLILQTSDGQMAVIDGYFSTEPAPLLASPDGGVLTPTLVDSFARSPSEFAAKETASDESPVGAVEEVTGHATVTRADGTVETITIGTPIYQGDIIETDAKGAVNITFIDETSMAVSENARLAVDQYTFDPATESGTTNLSILRGLFVFTSGLIGRDDPDDVKIDTPVGSIGIRGTIIAGQIDPSGESNITVLEGAIVVTNGSMETTLSQQFETVKLGSFDQPMQEMGVLPANDISARFSTISTVAPTLFTTINGSAAEQPAQNNTAPSSHSEQPAQQNDNAPANKDLAPTTQDQSAPTSLNTAPVTATPVAEAVTSMSLTGNTVSMGLPTMNTMMGQPSVDGAGNIAGSNSFMPVGTTTTTTTTTNLSSNIAQIIAIKTGGETILQTQPIVQTMPGILVAETGPLDPPAPPSVKFVQLPGFNDVAVAGAIVGNIRTGIAGTSYTLAGGIYDYQLIADGAGGMNVVLTTSGAMKLANSLTIPPMQMLTVTATLAGGEVLNGSFSPTPADANGARTINLDSSPANTAVISDGSAMYGAGYTISALGDLDEDGFDDFVFSNNTNAAGQNHSYLFMGDSTKVTNTSITALLSGGVSAPDINLNVNATFGSDFSESTVSGIGDFNGDGRVDYMVGQYLSGSVGGGMVSLVNGALPTQTITVDGVAAGDSMGLSVSGIGDINNDGYADVIFGQAGTDEAYLWQGFDVTWGITYPTPGVTEFTMSGGSSNTFGSDVSGIGDFNGDGYNDFAVGAPGEASGAGTMYVYAGSAAGGVTAMGNTSGSSTLDSLAQEISSLGDINGDGYSDILVGGNLSYNVGKIFLGNSSGSLGNTLSIEIPNVNYQINGGGAVGDFNADGYDDFVISLADAGKSHMYVVFGKDSLSSSTIDMNYLKNGANAMEFTTTKATNADMLEISGVGDINGDGYDDFAIGAYDVNGSAAGNGGMTLIYGRQTSISPTSHVGTSNIDILSDGGFSFHSFSGGAGNDVFRISNTAFLSIDGGGGNQDAIRSLGSLDFSNVNYEKISGIERLEFAGNNQTITLTMENLFNLMKTSDSGILKIGNFGGVVGSHLVLSDGIVGDAIAGTENTAANVNSHIDNYTAGTSAHSTSGSFDVFTIGGYKLMIDTSITIDAQ